jgi:hypothetical protein
VTWPRLTASPSAVTGSRISGHHGGVSTARALTRAGVCFAAVGLLAADARYYGALARHEKRWMDNLADRWRPAAGAARLITSMGATRHAIPLAAGASVFRSLFDGNRHACLGAAFCGGRGSRRCSRSSPVRLPATCCARCPHALVRHLEAGMCGRKGIVFHPGTPRWPRSRPVFWPRATQSRRRPSPPVWSAPPASTWACTGPRTCWQHGYSP